MLTNNSHRNIAWLLFSCIAGGYLVMALYYPRLYILATYEDLVGEWTQFYLFFCTLLLAAAHAVKSAKFRVFFALLSLACLYVAGEEISWGQRLFNITTPDFFDRHNLQGETNLHNIFTGPISTLTKQLIEYAVAAGLMGYGLVYPWLLKRRVRYALWLEANGLAASPLFLWPFFVLSAVLEIGLLQFNEAEIAEIMIPFALAIMTLNSLLANGYQADCCSDKCWDINRSQRLAGLTAALFVTVLGLAFATTSLCYESARLGPDMVDRYYNGVEKFAGRYKRFQQWHVATDLYHEVVRDQPNRASLRRNLYRCYDQLEMQDLALQQLNKAIEIDQQRLVDRPDSISAHISLVRNYLLMQNTEKTQLYLQKALSIGLKKKVKEPDNPAIAYWLGRSFQLRGDYVAAEREFERAVNLKPESLKYMKALMATRRLTEEGRVTVKS